MSISMLSCVVAVFLSLAISPALIEAQSSEPPGTSGRSNHTITGTALNSVTNEPIQRALIRIDGPVHTVAFTGADGRFSAAQVPEGPIFITAQRPGYSSGQAGIPTQFTVTSGSNDFSVPLTPDCALEGVILDSDGEPVEGVNVQVMVQQIWRGHKLWALRSSAMSDETGVYEVTGLQAGAVIVSTFMKPLMQNGEANGPPLAYPALYYPGGPDRASAQPIVLQPGQTARANFTLSLVTTHRVTGIVSGLPPNTAVYAQLDSDTGQGNFAPMILDQRTGRFTLLNIPDGDFRYSFSGQANSPGSRNLSAELRVSVSGADVNGLAVPLQLSPEIQVHLNRPSASAQAEVPQQTAMTMIVGNGNVMDASVQIYPAGSDRMQGYSAAPHQAMPGNAPRPSSDYFIQGVVPGEYAVVVQPSGNLCVDSVSSGGTDLSRQVLNIAEGSVPQPIIVNLRNDCASIVPTLHSEDRHGSGTVLVMSDSLNFEPIVTSVPIGSQIEFRNLTPGTYRVYAFDDASDLEYANPEAMREYKAVEVTVSSNQRAAVNLELNHRIEK